MAEPPEPEARPWRVGRSVGRTVYVQVGDGPSKTDELIGVMDTRELAARVVAAVNAQLGASPPRYPGTKFLTLCVLEGRRGGEVTVGESRLPVVPVLRSIRAYGADEAAVMWPQLSEGDLVVLARLVADLDSELSEVSDG